MSLPRDYLTDDIIKQLYSFTKRKVKKHQGTHICFTMTEYDVVHEVIEKTLSGERKWDQEKCPDFFSYLAGCAKSIIYNHSKKKETTTVRRECDLNYGKKNEKNASLDDYQKETTSNIDILSPYESREYAFDEFKKIMDYLSENRKDLIDLAEQILIQGRTKPKELALYFGITVKEVNVKKVALKRILIKLQEGEQ